MKKFILPLLAFLFVFAACTDKTIEDTGVLETAKLGFNTDNFTETSFDFSSTTGAVLNENVNTESTKTTKSTDFNLPSGVESVKIKSTPQEDYINGAVYSEVIWTEDSQDLMDITLETPYRFVTSSYKNIPPLEEDEYLGGDRKNGFCRYYSLNNKITFTNSNMYKRFYSIDDKTFHLSDTEETTGNLADRTIKDKLEIELNPVNYAIRVDVKDGNENYDVHLFVVVNNDNGYYKEYKMLPMPGAKQSDGSIYYQGYLNTEDLDALKGNKYDFMCQIYDVVNNNYVSERKTLILNNNINENDKNYINFQGGELHMLRVSINKDSYNLETDFTITFNDEEFKVKEQSFDI